MTLVTDTKDFPADLLPVLAKVRARLGDRDEWAAIEASDAKVATNLDRVLACSDYVADVLARHPRMLTEIIDGGRIHRMLEDRELELLFLAGNSDHETEAQFMRRLRLFRHRELLRIVYRDVAGWSDTEEQLRELSAVADTCIRAAFQRSSSEMQQRNGVPRAANGTEAAFIIVAMGKLGGGELNFSSDVDLVFLYTHSGETDGARSLSNEEYFRRMAQHFINLMSKKTADGFVYRVDARLRPFGDSGPLACSVDAFEDYLEQHGRNWERYAWIKARAVNIWAGTRDFYVNVLRPFVYRRYLDFGVFSSLREMKTMIEQEGRAAENRENIKLGPGGIREIEFIVQTLQLARGGTIRPLRERSLLLALDHLGAEGLMPAETVLELHEAYCFLRDLENHIQAIADRQTHELPTDDVDRSRLVLAMGYADWDELYTNLDRHRNGVKENFDEILRHQRQSDLGDDEKGEQPRILTDDRSALLSIAENVFENPEEPVQRIDALRSGALYKRLDEVARQRLDRLLPALLMTCGAIGPKGLAALERVLRIIEAIGRRSAYIALLNENSAALERLVRLCGSSGLLASQVAAHPLLLDELLDQRIFMEAPTRDDLEEDLRHRLDVLAPDENEQHFEALRNFQQAAVFRVAVADLSGTLPLMRVSDRLTDIAELVLAAALELAMVELVSRHGRPHYDIDGERHEAGFAIIGYGKLGGLELGYGSDLDVVFVHDSRGDRQETDGENPLDNAVFLSRLVRRITSILTIHTATGALYEVDTRLRPSGNSGLLVSSLQAFDKYQREDAWTWEHQALLRARPVAGSKAVMEAFAGLRNKSLLDYVHRDTLCAEVVKMRMRMRAELSKSTAEQFDIKQGEGGVIDIEFLVQYLSLLHAPEHAELLVWSDNVRQLEALDAVGVLTTKNADYLADAYRAYRERMHLLFLAGEPRLTSVQDFVVERKHVSALWSKHLGEPIVSA